MATLSETEERPAPNAPSPRRLHPASPVLDVSTLARQLLAPGAVAFSAGGVQLLALGVAVVLLVRVLAWRRRTYVLEAGVLRVEGGLVVRSQQLVPCERIQQVNLVQKLRHRVLGVAVLEVQTAVGGPGSEVRLEVLAFGEAECLRAALLAAKAQVESPDDERLLQRRDEDNHPAAVGAGAAARPAPERWVPVAWPVVELNYRQLALAGITGVQLLVVLALAPAGAQLAVELPWRPWDDLRLPALDVLGPVLLGALAVGFVAVWLASAAAVSIFSDAGYRLSLVGDELHLSRGLLDHKETTLPLARVQAVRVSASLPRRMLGLVSLRIQSAGTGAATADTRMAVPLLHAADLDRVLALVLPGAAPLPALASPPPAARRRALVRHVVPVGLVAAAVTAVFWPWGGLALCGVVPAAVLGAAAYRGLGHALVGGFLVARTGSLHQHTVVVPTVRSQSATVHADPWQRRSGLASLSVDLAGPGPQPVVRDEAAAVAEDVLARVMAGVEGRDAGPGSGIVQASG